MAETKQVQWWLATLDQYGNPTLCDGAHSKREGAEQAMYLYGRLGLAKTGTRYAICKVEIMPAIALAHGANEGAIAALNNIGLAP